MSSRIPRKLIWPCYLSSLALIVDFFKTKIQIIVYIFGYLKSKNTA